MSDLHLIFRALSYAAQQHATHKRKGREALPYINHPIKVSTIITQYVPDASNELIAAAVLHDVVEDSETTVEDLKNMFGATIASIVEEVSDDKFLPKKEAKQKQIQNAPHLSHNAKLIRICDKIANVRDICGEDVPNDWDYKTKIEYLNWAEEVVNAMGKFHDELEFTFKDEVRWGRLKIK
jgi:(p)ppGpp synthase/HD superfamily hydrolase